MKKLFSLLTLALLTMSAWAATEVTINFGDLYTENTMLADVSPITVDGVSLTFDKNTGSTAPQYYQNGNNARIYAGNTMTVEADCPITNIAFTYSSGTYYFESNCVSVGTYEDGAWTGTASSILFTNSTTHQVRITSMVVTLDEGDPVVTVNAPTFSPAACNFDESISVTLTAEEGATISYSTDGLAWTPYTAPIVLTETTTIYAKAAKNGVESSVVSATYTLNEPVSGDAIVFIPGDYEAVTNSPFSVTKNGVTIACTSGTITDEQFRFFKSQTTTISSTVGAITKIEFTCTANGSAQYGPGCFTTETGAYVVDGKVGTWTGNATSVEFVSSSNQVRATQVVVYIDGETPSVSAPVFDPTSCTFTGSQVVALSCETEGAAIYYSINDGEYLPYNAPFTLTATSTVKAYAELNGAQSAVNSATYTKRVEVTSVADANALGNKVDFVYYGDVAVTYQWYNANNQYYSTWIVDEQGNAGLIYGKQVPVLNQGDVIAEEWEAQKTTYNGIPEFQYPNNVVASGETWTINPVELTAVTTDDVNKYIIMKGQTITADATDTTGRRYYNADSLVVYNQFGVQLPAFEEGKTYDVIAIATIYHNAPELYIISATEVQGTDVMRGDVDQNQSVSIADVTALIDILLGGGQAPAEADCNLDQNVNIADVTALIDFLLTGNWAD